MKGTSRRKSQDSSSSEGNSKRKKIDKDEREKEIEELSKAMKDIDEQIEYKQLHIKRQKSIHEYSKCDQIMGEIIKLRNEKKIQEKQLKRMERRMPNLSGTITGKTRRKKLTRLVKANENGQQRHWTLHKRSGRRVVTFLPAHLQECLIRMSPFQTLSF